MELVAAHAQADAEILADRLTHGFQHFDAEAHAVFQRAAVLVRAEVRRGLQNWSIRCWWAADISMPSMPASLHALRGRREVGDDAADLFDLR